jgi:hypothetical protein
MTIIQSHADWMTGEVSWLHFRRKWGTNPARESPEGGCLAPENCGLEPELFESLPNCVYNEPEAIQSNWGNHVEKDRFHFSVRQPVPPKKDKGEPDHGPRPDEGYVGIQNHSAKDIVYYKEVAIKLLGE